MELSRPTFKRFQDKTFEARKIKKLAHCPKLTYCPNI